MYIHIYRERDTERVRERTLMKKDGIQVNYITTL